MAGMKDAGVGGCIENAGDLLRLRRSLRGRPRDLLFFELAVGTGLHAKDLLQLTVADLGGLKPGGELRIERIPKRSNRIAMTPAIHSAFAEHIRGSGLAGGDFLFRSRKSGRPLTLVSLSRLASGWFRRAGLPGMGGVLALRRTFERHHGARSAPAGGAKACQAPPPGSPEVLVSRREAVFRALQKDIVSGRIIPGHRIFIEAVSRRMGVSAIPVREAMAMLEAGGFVHSDRKRGYLVNELSESNLKEILELRLLLECKAAELAALRRGEGDVARLEACQRSYAAARTANDSEALLRTNKEFHHAIYGAAGMPILKSHIDRIWDRVSPYYHIMFRQVEKPNPVVGIHYHQGMIEAIREKDPRMVRRWVKADLTDSTRFVIELFNLHKKLLERS
jgi:DNA-binding GntR family transcriptional regulator